MTNPRQPALDASLPSAPTGSSTTREATAVGLEVNSLSVGGRFDSFNGNGMTGNSWKAWGKAYGYSPEAHGFLESLGFIDPSYGNDAAPSFHHYKSGPSTLDRCRASRGSANGRGGGPGPDE